MRACVRADAARRRAAARASSGQLRRRARRGGGAARRARRAARAARARAAVTVPGRFQVVAEAPADDLRRRAQPERHRRARARAARGRRRRAAWSRCCRCSTTRTPPGCCASSSPLCSRRGLHRVAEPARAVAGDARLAVEPAVAVRRHEIEAEPHAAVGVAQELAGADGAVVATGSIYLVADLLVRRRATPPEVGAVNDAGPACCR